MTGLTVIGGIVFFCLGVYLFYYAMKRIKMGRQIKDTQKSNIVSLKPGLVEIQGKVEADDAISSPYSNTACVHYRFSATKRQRRPSSDSHILQDIEIGSGRKGVPFFLRDDTGRVIIDPEEAEILRLTVEELDLPTRIANALRKGGFKTVADLQNSSRPIIAKVKNLGEKSVEIIEEALEKKEVKLGGGQDEA